MFQRNSWIFWVLKNKIILKPIRALLLKERKCYKKIKEKRKLIFFFLIQNCLFFNPYSQHTFFLNGRICLTKSLSLIPFKSNLAILNSMIDNRSFVCINFNDFIFVNETTEACNRKKCFCPVFF